MLNEGVIAAYQQVFDDYHQLHPNITFTLVKKDDLYDDIVASVPVGTGPDIVMWANTHT